MIVYLLRHAKALPRQKGIVEEDRYLTEEGRLSFRQTAGRLMQQGLKPDLILSSPLVRSVQTAEILASVLDYDGPLLVLPELSPGFGRREFSRLLKQHEGLAELLLVGHEPDLSLLISGLLGMRGHFALKKGDAVALQVQPGTLAEFLWRTFRGEVVTSPLDQEV